MTLLAPHREDLHRSGLDADTIARSGIYSAPERQVRDLLGYGVGSGMVIPYSAANGDRPYVRVRLDQPDKAGKRYRSPSKVQNHLYVPPTLDPKRLPDVSFPLYFTEGEKKALKAVQEGLVCVGLVGVWGWRTRFPDKTRGVPLPELEALALAGRTVYIVFDSDRLTNTDVQKAERALAAYLVGRGATVLRIPLPPGPDHAKVGLDDYLVTHSIETFCAIEPEPIALDLEDGKATEPGPSATTPRVTLTADAGPRVTRQGDAYVLAWTHDDGRAAAITLSAVREHSDGLHAECTVTLGDREPVWVRFGLAAPNARTSLVKTLDALDRTIDWRSRLDRACRETAALARQGSPAVPVTPQMAPGEQHAIYPIAPKSETAVLAGDGGAGKTTLALAVTLAALNGATLPGGIRTVRRITSALWLDYETNKASIDELTYLLLAAHGWDATGLHYKEMMAPLADQIAAVKADVVRLGAELVVVDSQAPASGIDPEGANAAVAFHTALRSLGPGVTKLVVAHVNAQAAAQARGAARPFGSVFNMNLPRSVWEVRRSNDDDADDLQVALYHRKVNRGRRHPPIALTFAYEADRLTVYAAQLADSPDLRARAPLHAQITAALSNGAKTVAALASELDAKPEVVRSTLNKLKAKGRAVQVPATEPQAWGLAAR